ncbi:MAG: hypothetical protein M1839_004011 [Geoglossum umbratile]|nr:MAG: hypothetical protein M1839_004011 [Geoglossum umbratile]
MTLHLLPAIFMLSMPTFVTAVGKANFTAACRDVRLQMIANNQSLAGEPRLQCGAQYSSSTPPAMQILTDLPTCLRLWPGWQISDPNLLGQWVGPLVGFLLPALIFVLSIPRAPNFRMPRGEKNLNRNIFLSIGWLGIIFFLMVIDVLLWIIVVFGLAGPMMVGAMDEGIKDWRILREVKSGNLNGQEKRYTLTLILIGTFKPKPGALAENAFRDICNTRTVSSQEARHKLHQLLNHQGSYGIQVGAPVAFYLGAYAYALFDASSKLGDNDTAHAIAFGVCREIINERQRQRCALLKQVQERWDQEHPVNEVELQLPGHKFSKDVKTILELSDEMLPIQKRLVGAIMTLLGTTIEEEFHQRNAAISAVAAYYKFKGGGAHPRGRSPRRRTSTLAKEASLQSISADTKKQVLSAAMLSVYKENRPTICFVCLEKRTLELSKCAYSFASSEDQSKHFKWKHLSNGRAGQQFECKVCQMSFEHKMHLQNHALKIHRTVS